MQTTVKTKSVEIVSIDKSTRRVELAYHKTDGSTKSMIATIIDESRFKSLQENDQFCLKYTFKTNSGIVTKYLEPVNITSNFVESDLLNEFISM